ncbi:N-acetylglucosaminyl-diphospho-decaprenol L-rhamnosyltransferase [mine drainage metagenome]|uniref:N-acetylglucosaminyl-diphospho-decaprenol L-rhamnosyltransferase n=1 Tax=mine drainage metagenome TaxID=410659 RepID=A0A1J5SLR8_9ZZZZ
MTVKCSASLVLYNCAPDMFLPAITSFLEGHDEGLLVIADNSKQPQSHPLFEHPRVRYLFNNCNMGFGAAHNRAIAAVGADSDIHLILNPDISFGADVIPHLLSVMQSTPEIGALMPRINYPDGSLQRLCKLLPTPVDLILRRFIPIKSVQTAINRRYELHDLPQDRLIDTPTISGCFLLVRTEILRKLGGFDERYFMYLEDVDLVRRIGDVARVVYEPRVSVTHAYAKGSYRNKKLLTYHMASAIRYFTKWGWLFDSTRRKRNSAVLSYLRQLNQ